MVGSTSYPVSVSSLEFPTLSLSFSQTLATLRRSALSITNRLLSIEADSIFVQEVAQHYGLPLVANERCGSWYIPPEKKSGSAYFKSTDGHAGQWDFSPRRLNLQLLSIAREHGGCVVVDSTRRGKRSRGLLQVMPDALSKTVPIWCAVVNRTLFPEKPRFHGVQFPPNNLLGASEESQIESRIDGFVAVLKDLKLDLDELRSRVGKPMRVCWAWRSNFSPESQVTGDEFHTIVLCSASKRVEGAEMSEGGYIQGAGDDSESWALGLNPTIFWENKNKFFNTKEEELPDLIEDRVQKYRTQNFTAQVNLIRPTRNIYISKVKEDADYANTFDLIINCNSKVLPDENSKILNLGCGVGKLGSRDLRNVLERVKDFIVPQLGTNPSRSLLVTCETGRDLSAGAVLMIICLFYNDIGEFVGLQPDSPIDKQFIKQRLVWIITSNHEVNPSRSTLQSVNSFLMQRPD